MSDKSRRDILRAAGVGLASGITAACLGKSEARENAEFQAQKLQRVLLDDEAFQNQYGSYFVGNPNSYDFGYTALGFTTDDASSVDKQPEKIWENIAETRDTTVRQLVDERAADRIEMNLLADQSIDTLVLYPEKLDVSQDLGNDYADKLRHLTGVETDVDTIPVKELTSDTIEDQAAINDDSMVFGFVDLGEEDYGRSAYHLNGALIDPQKTLVEESAGDAVNVMLHEFFHSGFNLRHIPGENNLMGGATYNPADVEPKEQALEMAKRYLSGELRFSTGTEDGKATTTAYIEPTYTIDDGEKYLIENTENVLDWLEFPSEEWQIMPQGDTVRMSREGVQVELYPSSKSLYEDIRADF